MKTMKRVLAILAFALAIAFPAVTLVTISGCAAGVSTYEYDHTNGTTRTHVVVKSANEINQMEMGINRDTGTLDVKIGELDKKSEVSTVVQGFENVTGNIAGMLQPLMGLNQQPPVKQE